MRVLAIAVAFALSSCVTARQGSDFTSADEAGQWYKGNTHAHTTIGDGDSTPETVAKWYLDRDYNFLVLSEHNKFIDPATVELPEDRRSDFILIPGQEVTGKRAIHMTAMNVSSLVDWQYDYELSTTRDAVQFQVDGVRSNDGEPILNHPNYKWGVAGRDILGIDGLKMFELYNGHPRVNNQGDGDHISTEEIWDLLLTHGKEMYAVASDDAHHFQEMAPSRSNPGRGWVMAWAKELTPDAITDAMSRGRFYSSSGVFLASVEQRANKYVVVVDKDRTAEALHPALRGKPVREAEPGFRIDFVGPNGTILATTQGLRAVYVAAGDAAYVRVRVTFARALETDAFEEFYAWGQPVFMNAGATLDGNR